MQLATASTFDAGRKEQAFHQNILGGLTAMLVRPKRFAFYLLMQFEGFDPRATQVGSGVFLQADRQEQALYHIRD